MLADFWVVTAADEVRDLTVLAVDAASLHVKLLCKIRAPDLS